MGFRFELPSASLCPWARYFTCLACWWWSEDSGVSVHTNLASVTLPWGSSCGYNPVACYHFRVNGGKHANDACHHSLNDWMWSAIGVFWTWLGSKQLQTICHSLIQSCHVKVIADWNHLGFFPTASLQRSFFPGFNYKLGTSQPNIRGSWNLPRLFLCLINAIDFTFLMTTSIFSKITGCVFLQSWVIIHYISWSK